MSAQPAQSVRLPPRFAAFFATSLAARAVGIGCQLLQVPLVVSALGSEAFGLWVTMTSITSLMQFADLGLGIGAQNRLTEQFSRAEFTSARALFGSVFVFLAGVGLALGSLLSLAILTLDLPALLHLRDPATTGQATGAALALGWVFCAGFPLGLAQRLAFARQEGWMHNIAQAAGSAGALGIVAWGAHARWSLGALVASAQGAQLLANAALLAVQLVQLRWHVRRRFVFRFRPVRELLAPGAYFSVQQVVSTVMFSLPQVIISASLGAAAVTPFNLVQRLFNLFAVVQNAFLLPLWPAYAAARARREFDWMRQALRRSFHATVFGCVAPLVMCACFAPQLIRLWVGAGTTPPDFLLIGLLCGWNVLVLLQQPCLYLLVAVSEIRRSTCYSLLGALTGAALMFALVRSLGVPGVVLGLILGYLPFNFAGNLLEVRRYLRDPDASPEPSPLPAT